MRDARFIAAGLHTCAAPPTALEVVGLSLQPQTDLRHEARHRFELPLAEAERLALAVLEAVAVQRYRSLCHSLKLSGIPSLDVSPQEGV